MARTCGGKYPKVRYHTRSIAFPYLETNSDVCTVGSLYPVPSISSIPSNTPSTIILFHFGILLTIAAATSYTEDLAFWHSMLLSY